MRDDTDGIDHRERVTDVASRWTDGCARCRAEPTGSVGSDPNPVGVVAAARGDQRAAAPRLKRRARCAHLAIWPAVGSVTGLPLSGVAAWMSADREGCRSQPDRRSAGEARSLVARSASTAHAVCVDGGDDGVTAASGVGYPAVPARVAARSATSVCGTGCPISARIALAVLSRRLAAGALSEEEQPRDPFQRLDQNPAIGGRIDAIERRIKMRSPPLRVVLVQVEARQPEVTERDRGSCAGGRARVDRTLRILT